MNEIVLFCLVGFSGMLVQSFVGFAGSLVAIPLFALFLSPRDAVPAYNVVMLLVNAMLVFEARKHVQWRRIGRLLAGGLIGVPLGAYGLKHLPLNVLGLVISIATLTFALLFLLKIRVPLKENTPTQLSVGLLSGVLGGSISESGPPMVIYGLSRQWDKNAFRTTLLTYFLFLSLTATACYAILGLLTRDNLKLSAVAIGPMLAAGWLGVALKDRVGEKTFRGSVLAVILVVGVLGIWRHLLGN